MTAAAPRVRFAPSPTGYFHVGSARAALFNWLFARRSGGTFVLRIEDTDELRNRDEWLDGIVSALDWLGMAPDEGPYRQSERAGSYQVAIESLWESGHLYACDCSRDDIDARTKERATPGYDGFCRDRNLARAPGLALRFRTPDTGSTVIPDLVRGEVSFPHEAMEDFICVKGNGLPLFALANVVDDRDMAISHVIRGEDLLPTTPKQVLLWNALNHGSGATDEGSVVALPKFAHLPLLVNEQRKKLSKRRDPVAVESYRDKGYLPSAFRNYLALLGWSPPGELEKVSIEAMVEGFRLEDVHHAPAFFDVKKMTHLNGEYIREMTTTAFVASCQPWINPGAGEWAPGGWQEDGTFDPTSRVQVPWPTERFDPDVFLHMAPLVQERVATLGEVPAMVDFLFMVDPVIDPDSWAKAITKDDKAKDVLLGARSLYETCDWDRDTLHQITEDLGTSFERSLGKVQAPIRVAVTGRRVGPPLFESLEVLGRPEVTRRIDAALSRIDGERTGS
jgi:glutamyl-tRNA synthetase